MGTEEEIRKALRLSLTFGGGPHQAAFRKLRRELDTLTRGKKYREIWNKLVQVSRDQRR